MHALVDLRARIACFSLKMLPMKCKHIHYIFTYKYKAVITLINPINQEREQQYKSFLKDFPVLEGQSSSSLCPAQIESPKRAGHAPQ